MTLPKIVIFDVGGTIINNTNVNYDNLLAYLYENVYNYVSKDEFMTTANHIIKNTFLERNKKEVEYPFIDFINTLNLLFNNKKKLDINNLQCQSRKAMYQNKLIENVKFFINYLLANNVELYAFSNSTFSSNEIKEELDEFGLGDFFKDIISSADYYYRKPNNFILSLLISRFEKWGISKEQIWFIGNDYEIDIKMAVGLGIKSFLYTNCDDKHLEYTAFRSYNDLIKEIMYNE